MSSVASMSVKEVLQSLVDDNLVDTDKIGTSIYFWAYPSKAMHTVSLDSHLYQSFKHQCSVMSNQCLCHCTYTLQRQQKLQQLTDQISECERKIASTTKLLKQANSGREQSVSTKDQLFVLSLYSSTSK